MATVYTPSPTLNTNDNNGNTNFRVLVKLSAASNGSLQVRFRSSASGSDVLEIYGASFGKWDGVTLDVSHCDMTTPSFRLTFSGGNSTTVAPNSTVTSDLIAHPGVTLSAGDWVIVAFYNQNAGPAFAGQRYSSGHTTATTMFRPEGGLSDRSQDQTITVGGTWAIVGGVQPGGSGGYNFTVDLVSTNDAGGYTLAALPGTVTLAGQAATLATTAKTWALVGVRDVTINSSGNYTIAEPTGTQLGDLLVVDLVARSNILFTNADYTFPHSDTGGNTTNGTTASDTSFQTGYCIRGSSAPNSTFTRSGGSRAFGTLRAYRSNQGAPVFDTSAAVGLTLANTTVTLSGGVSTAAVGELLVAGLYIARAASTTIASGISGLTTVTGASGATDNTSQPLTNTWTERSDRGNITNPTVGLACFDVVKSNTGSTSDIQVDTPSAALHGLAVMAFKHRVFTAYTMPVTAGTITLAGQAVTLTKTTATTHRTMPADAGVLALSGRDVTLRIGRKTAAGTGTLTLAGQVVTTRYAHSTVAGLGTLTLAGQSVAMRNARKAPAGQGALTPSGQNVTLRYTRKMPAGHGTVAMAGPAVNLIKSGSGAKLLPAGIGFPVLAGQTVTLRYGRVLRANPGTITLAGQAMAARLVRRVVADAGGIVLSGRDANLVYHERVSYALPAECGVITLAGTAADLTTHRAPPPPEVLRFGRTAYFR